MSESPSSPPALGRAAAWMFSVAGALTAISPFVADWNATHIYNPLWPPHAKFHNAQTMLLGALLGVMTVVFAWWRRDGRTALVAASALAAFYWVSQGLSIAFPGAGFFDQPLGGRVPPQPILDVAILAFVGTAAWIGHRHVASDPAP